MDELLALAHALTQSDKEEVLEPKANDAELAT